MEMDTTLQSCSASSAIVAGQAAVSAAAAAHLLVLGRAEGFDCTFCCVKPVRQFHQQSAYQQS